MLLEGDLLSVYSRVFADTGENGVMMPVKNPMSGTGLRWKRCAIGSFPRRRTAVAAERAKWRIRYHAAAPAPSSLMAANTATNGTERFRLVCPKPVPRCGAICPPDIQAWTADYRVSWHQKVANGQTIEPYAHVQGNGYQDKGTQGAQVGGVGVRWNIWTGETQYDAAAQSQSRRRVSTYL